ncbi:MAG TPA: hypothetical protein VGF24_35675 [Vicinamibacterales bacterium]|jgi:hypothetical protein
MKMDVKNRLSRSAVGVEHCPVPTLVVAVLPGERRGGAVHGTDERVVTRGEIIERGDVFARDDQRVQRGLRVDVGDGDELIVLMQEFARDLTRDDFAEQTVVHDVLALARAG